jgi:hypothetical protein
MAKHIFTGVFIPAKIWISKTLIAQEKMMLAEIKALSEDTGWCYASNRHFSEWLGCLPTNISNYIQKFKEAEMIEVRYDNLKTFSGRKMRVNLAWYHGLQDPINPSIPAEPPSIPAEPPSIPAEPPSIPAVTERQFKNTSILNESEGERTPPAPNPSNLKEEKKENGLVAPRRDPHQWQGQIIGPPAEYIASDPVYWKPVPESEKESTSDKLSTKNVSLSVKAEIPPLPKVAPKGIPPFGDSTSEPGPLANFSDREILAMEAENAACWAKIIDPALPGVTLVEAAPKTIQPWEHPNPQSPKELKTVLLRYADQNPENWRDNVLESGRATNWPAEKIDECLTDFCAWQFQQDSTKGKLSQYTAGFSLWLKRQPRYDSMNAPKEGSPTRNAQQSQKANLNHWGANPGGYEEKQAF